MKRLFVVGLLILAVTFPTMALTKDEEKLVQYKVSITYTYDSIPGIEAASLIKEAMKKNTKACSVVIYTEKVGSSGDKWTVGKNLKPTPPLTGEFGISPLTSSLDND